MPLFCGVLIWLYTNHEVGIDLDRLFSSIVLITSDKTRVSLAHVDDIIVKVGQKVSAGEKIAKVGNNGYSRIPHTHVAAWKDDKPLQIQFDQKTLDLKERRNNSNN